MKDLFDSVDVCNVVVLLKKHISTIDYDVDIRKLSLSLSGFYIIQIRVLLALNVVKYFL